MKRILYVNDLSAGDYVKDISENNILTVLDGADCLCILADLPLAEANAQEVVETLLPLVKENECDCLFTLDYYPILSLACGAMGIKYLAWIVSAYKPGFFDYSVKNPWNILFASNKSLVRDYEEMGVSNVSFLPLASDSDIEPICTETIPEDRDFSDIFIISNCIKKPSSLGTKLNGLLDSTKGYLDGCVENRKRTISDAPFFLSLPEYVKKDITDSYGFKVDSLENTAHLFDHRVFFPHIDESIGREFFLRRFGYPPDYRVVCDFEIEMDEGDPSRIDQEKAEEIMRDKKRVCICAFVSAIGDGSCVSKEMWKMMAKGHLTILPSFVDTSFIQNCEIPKYSNVHELQQIIRRYMTDYDERVAVAKAVQDAVKASGGFEDRVNRILQATD